MFSILKFLTGGMVGFSMIYYLNDQRYAIAKKNIYIPMKKEFKKPDKDFSWKRIIEQFANGI